MHNSNIGYSGGIMGFGDMVIRQFRTAQSWHQGLLRGERQWPMKFHYAMWAVMGIMIVMSGAIYRGQQDILANKAYMRGQAAVLIMLTPKQLSEYSI